MTIQQNVLNFTWSCSTDDVDAYEKVVAAQQEFVEQNEHIVEYTDLELGESYLVVNIEDDKEVEAFEKQLKSIIEDAGGYCD